MSTVSSRCDSEYLKNIGRLVVTSRIKRPKTKKEESDFVSKLQFAEALTTNQRMLISKLMLMVDDEQEANRLCKKEELQIDDSETLVSETRSEDESEYEPSFIDDASCVSSVAPSSAYSRG